MQRVAVLSFLLLSIVFLLFMVMAAPHGQILSKRTPPSTRMIADRFTHFHYTGRALCDIGRMVGLCGDIGSLTKRGSGGF